MTKNKGDFDKMGKIIVKEDVYSNWCNNAEGFEDKLNELKNDIKKVQENILTNGWKGSSSKKFLENV